MTKEGEGVILFDGCPEHGTEFLYRKWIDKLLHEVCSVSGCSYCNVVLKERRQSQPILFEDRRKSDI